jgi:tetratricopeptide (TPR) repeat protein
MTVRGTVSICIFLLFFSLYLCTQVSEIYTADSGELTAVAHVLGVPHPTGYPLYSSIAKAFQLFVPLGTIGYRTALFSAVAGALSVWCLFLIASHWLSVPAGFFSACLFGLAKSFWSQTTIQEVYSFHILLLMGMLYCAAEFLTRSNVRHVYLFAFLGGLSLTHHLLTLMSFPAFFILLFSRQNFRQLRINQFATGILLGIMGWSVQLLLPLRSMTACPLRWMPVHDIQGFLFQISGKQFRPIMFNMPFSHVSGNFNYFTHLFLDQWGWIIAVIAGAGLILLSIFRARQTVFWLVYFAVPVIFSINYRIVDIEVYYLQAYIPVAYLCGVSAHYLMRCLERLNFRFWWIIPYSLLLISVPVSILIRNFHPNDRSNHRIGYNFGIDMYNSLPLDAVLVTQGWSSPFVLSYLEYVLHYRPDVLVSVDYKGLHFLQADRENWDLPLYTTVPMEISGMEDKRYSPEGMVYRSVADCTVTGAKPVTWDRIRLSKRQWQHIHLDMHGRALASKYHYMYGETLSAEGFTTRSIEEFKTAEHLGEGNNLVLNNLSAIYFKMGDLDEAERLARKSIAIDDWFYQAHHNLGNVLLRKGRYTEAINEFKHGKDQLIAMGRSHQALGFSYLQNEEYALAIEELESALRYKPGSLDIQLNLASSYVGAGRLKKADQLLNELSMRYPNNSDVLNNQGVVEMKKQEPELAAEFFQKALTFEPDHLDTKINIGILRAIEGKYDEAEHIFRILEGVIPENVKLLNNYALLLFQTDRKEMAIQYWRKSLELKPFQLHLMDNLKRAGCSEEEISLYQKPLRIHRKVLSGKH